MHQRIVPNESQELAWWENISQISCFGDIAGPQVYDYERALSFFGSCLFACLNTWIDWQIVPKTMVDWFVNNRFTIWACTICSDIIRWHPFLVRRNKLSLFSTHSKSLYYIRCLIIKMREIKLRCLLTCVLWWKKSNNMWRKNFQRAPSSEYFGINSDKQHQRKTCVEWIVHQGGSCVREAWGNPGGICGSRKCKQPSACLWALFRCWYQWVHYFSKEHMTFMVRRLFTSVAASVVWLWPEHF